MTTVEPRPLCIVCRQTTDCPVYYDTYIEEIGLTVNSCYCPSCYESNTSLSWKLLYVSLLFVMIAYFFQHYFINE